MIYRGSSPTHTFVVPHDLNNVKDIYITYRQNNCNVIHKSLSANTNDISYDVNRKEIKVKLYQKDTLSLTCGNKYVDCIVTVQISILFNDGNVIVGDIIKEKVVNTQNDFIIGNNSNSVNGSGSGSSGDGNNGDNGGTGGDTNGTDGDNSSDIIYDGGGL